MGVGLAEQARFIEIRERRGATRLDRLEAQIQALSNATDRHGSQVEYLTEKIEHLNNNVAALPATVEITVQRSTSSLVDAMSNLELRPSFQNLYVAASGFQSDAESAPAKVQTASAVKPNDVEPRRHRQPYFRRPLIRSNGVMPSDIPAGGAPGPYEATPAPVSEP